MITDIPAAGSIGWVIAANVRIKEDAYNLPNKRFLSVAARPS